MFDPDGRSSTDGTGMAETRPELVGVLGAALGSSGAVRHRRLDRLALANDASHYALVPEAVVVPADEGDVVRLLRAASAHGFSVTFRSGGTSLNGQGVTSSVLVDTRRHFRAVRVNGAGETVTTQPGATLRQVNAHLARHGRKLGPDPASEAACTIGGVVANNSSGMACGTAVNTYRTLESLTFVLPSGTVIDSAARDAAAQLREAEPDLYDGLARLRDRVRSNPRSVTEIERQFAMKNTMGYSLNAFLDHDEPLDILVRLIVGSEGTLAFVSEMTFRTVVLLPHAATGLLVFPDLFAATRSLTSILATGPATIELLDAASLAVAEGMSEPVGRQSGPDARRQAALLVEYQASTAEELRSLRADSGPALDALELAGPPVLTESAASRNRLWTMRKGLYAAVAGVRPTGTTALLEDIAVPVAELAGTCEALTRLFGQHGFDRSVIFGHAKDGNIHFLLNVDFGDPGTVERYDAITADMIDLVLGAGGTLKAEHGTGRMMAPYVRRQYGDELYDVMRQVKRLCDPDTVLSPGIVLEEEDGGPAADLKSAPPVESEVDRCVECGYCEPVCPSRDLTLTPRQRIVLRRAIERARLDGDRQLVRELERDYAYEAIDTCAVDGMCQTACPVLINTGDLVARLRSGAHPPRAEAAWQVAARHWKAGTRTAARALDVAATMPPVAEAVSKGVRRMSRGSAVPVWSRDLPPGGAPRPDGVRPADSRAVLFPACVGSIFGSTSEDAGTHAALVELCRRAGVEVTVPDRMPSLCCGTPWKSKGYLRGYAAMSEQVRDAVWQASDGGRLPVVCDASSCTEGLRRMLTAGESPVTVVDAVEFAHAELLPRLRVTHQIASLTLHPTCSSTQLGLNDVLTALARAIAEEVRVPEAWGCCAFAGDRGLLHPELTASATAAEAAAVTAIGAQEHASCNRTCEIGMTRATGRTYSHIVQLVERVTRPL